LADETISGSSGGSSGTAAQHKDGGFLKSAWQKLMGSLDGHEESGSHNKGAAKEEKKQDTKADATKSSKAQSG
ncbi:hypothetical protein KEM52_001510, partial [Ascosphaera acerosa]